MKTLAVVGSRTRSRQEYERIKTLVFNKLHTVPQDVVIISGGAPTGADKAAREYCRFYNRKYLEAVAFWSRPDGSTDKSAGHRRNSTIVEAADTIVAFWDGQSPGTKDTISKAEACGKELEIIKVPSATFKPTVVGWVND
jgi:molybdopterin biosynthesis enzyme